MLPSVCRRIFDAFFSGDASGDRPVYGCTFNKHMDFAEPGMYLRSGGRISSEKIHGTVHL